MCLPSFDLIIRHIKRTLRKSKEVKSIFVASDNDYMIEELNNALSRINVKILL